MASSPSDEPRRHGIHRRSGAAAPSDFKLVSFFPAFFTIRRPSPDVISPTRALRECVSAPAFLRTTATLTGPGFKGLSRGFKGLANEQVIFPQISMNRGLIFPGV